MSVAKGIVRIPEARPPELFGDSYSGTTFLGEIRGSHNLVHGLGPDWRQVATTGDNALISVG